jgi:putative ABC transport system permease protein
MEANRGGSFSPQDLNQVSSIVGERGLAVPFAYAVARTSSGDPIVVAGTDFELVKKLNPWWEVSSWPTHAGEGLLGVRAAKLLAPQNAPFELSREGRRVRLSPAGTVHTGAGEDSRVYISLPEFQSWTDLHPSVIEIAAYGPGNQVSSLLTKLQQSFPAAEIHPVRQITEGEAGILGKTRSTLLWSAIFIIATAALCVLATLTGWLFDRRRDFAIMKAIGASDRLISAFVAGEAAALACVGGLLGYLGGIGIAAWIGRANFHAPVTPRISLLFPILMGCLIVTLLATLLPLQLLRRIQPAMILRGE